MKISIVTPWLDHPEYIPGYAYAVQNADEVIIVDTGSSGENFDVLWDMADNLKKHGLTAQITEFLGGGNYGHWCNAGLAEATGDVVIFLNNDVYAEGDWLKAFRELEEGNLYGPGMQYPLDNGEVFRICGIESSSFLFLSGWCIAATRETWKRLFVPDSKPEGPWDTTLFPGAGYWEDNDLCFRAQIIGMGLRHTPVPLMHLDNGTSKTKPEYYKDVARNKAAFIRRVAEVIG